MSSGRPEGILTFKEVFYWRWGGETFQLCALYCYAPLWGGCHMPQCYGDQSEPRLAEQRLVLAGIRGEWYTTPHIQRRWKVTTRLLCNQLGAAKAHGKNTLMFLCGKACMMPTGYTHSSKDPSASSLCDIKELHSFQPSWFLASLASGSKFHSVCSLWVTFP